MIKIYISGKEEDNEMQKNTQHGKQGDSAEILHFISDTETDKYKYDL